MKVFLYSLLIVVVGFVGFVIYLPRKDYTTNWKHFSYKNSHKFDSFHVPKPLGDFVYGIDISHHQDSIDWSYLSKFNSHGDSIKFVWMKATEGIKFKDKHFSYNWIFSKKYGFKRGAYHFFRPLLNVDSQVLNFIYQVPLSEDDLNPVLDFEVTDKLPVDSLVPKIKHWLFQVENFYKRKPIIYTNKRLYKTIIKPYFSNYPLWIAHYDTSDVSKAIESEKWAVWQFTSKGRADGVRNKIDINVMKKDTFLID